MDLMQTYKLEIILVKCSDENKREILRHEELGRFPTEKEAQWVLELVELPDPKHSIVI